MVMTLHPKTERPKWRGGERLMGGKVEAYDWAITVVSTALTVAIVWAIIIPEMRDWLRRKKHR